MFGKKKLLRVEFYDLDGGRLVGYDELRLKDVPESFKDETWVEIDGDRWKVARVDPAKPKQALREGQLKVHVQLVERRQPAEEKAAAAPVKAPTLYRTASRADQLPRLSGRRDDLQLLEIASWAWRGVEFTTAANRSAIMEVFTKVEELTALCTTEQDGRRFFTRQYERYDMHAPMRGTRLSLETVITDYFPAARAVDGLTFVGADKVADSTFVFKVDAGIAFYGQEFDDHIRYFALVPPDELFPETLRADAGQLEALMRKKDLVMVDWERNMVVPADAGLLYDYFLQVATRIQRESAAVEAIPVVDFEGILDAKPVEHVDAAQAEPAGQVVASDVPATVETLAVAESAASAESSEVAAPVESPSTSEALAPVEAEAVAEPVESVTANEVVPSVEPEAAAEVSEDASEMDGGEGGADQEPAAKPE